MNVIIPLIDRVKPLIDLREQVVEFKGQPVITEDNLVVLIDTVLFFQITDPRAADYEIVNYIQAIDQITATMLRSVIGSMDLEQTLTSRDKINTLLRGVLDDASGKWGIRVTRVEIKAIDPPTSVKDAMEKQMRAERDEGAPGDKGWGRPPAAGRAPRRRAARDRGLAGCGSHLGPGACHPGVGDGAVRRSQPVGRGRPRPCRGGPRHDGHARRRR